MHRIMPVEPEQFLNWLVQCQLPSHGWPWTRNLDLEGREP